MTFKEIRRKALKTYYPALLIERLFSRRMRKIIIGSARFLTLALGVISIGLFGSGQGQSWLYGLFFISLAWWMLVFAIQCFYHAYYFKDSRGDVPMNFSLAYLFYRSRERKILKRFVRTKIGKRIMMRTGISRKKFDYFLATRRALLSNAAFSIPDHTQPITIADYIVALLAHDKGFEKFLFSEGIQPKDFIAIAEWIVDREQKLKNKEQWWSRENLGRIPGLGKDWSYGQIFGLEKYARELRVESVYGAEELKQLELILAQAHEANVILAGDDAALKFNVIARLAQSIEEGTIVPELEHKRIIVLDTDLLLASTKTKGNFESEFISLLQEAVHAGNIILVFPDLPAFMSSAETLGANIIALLDRYITSPDLHIVGLTGVEAFHKILEPNTALMSNCEKIILQELHESNILRILQNEIIALESQFHIFFTYPALVAIATSAEQYFSEGTMPDKAIDLAQELAPKIRDEDKKIVRKSDVLRLIESKTGIPVGHIKVDERTKLLNLEEILHKRIIGQDEAVKAIANAVRRARSGINNPDRPLASFLFLGPTGVGKTETTKALAQIFFGQEADILRLDMSEYSGPDALSKLIGSFNDSKTGVLSNLIRERPYGVLLLDEFEKTTSEVMNIFLQILDEGFFSDMTGKKINARNLLIIATSNAGSELIWDAIKKGDDLSHARELIIDSIIKARIFKPELLNRFDGVIIFHPLAREHLEKVATLQLEKLKNRLAERGYDLVITKDLTDYLIKFGTDPKFGARPLQRAIQDSIEHAIAEKMIKGEIKPGSEIVLTSQDLGILEH